MSHRDHYQNAISGMGSWCPAHCTGQIHYTDFDTYHRCRHCEERRILYPYEYEGMTEQEVLDHYRKEYKKAANLLMRELGLSKAQILNASEGMKPGFAVEALWKLYVKG